MSPPFTLCNLDVLLCRVEGVDPETLMQRSYRQFQMERALPGLEARVARLEVGRCMGIVAAGMGFAGLCAAGAGGPSGKAGVGYCCNRAPAAVLSGVVCALPGRGSDNFSGELVAGACMRCAATHLLPRLPA